MARVIFAIIVGLIAVGDAAASEADPMAKVVTLLNALSSKVEAEGQAEQKAYDAYACWVESTLGKKTTDISDAEKLIGDLQTDVNSLAGSNAANAATIKQLEKDIAKNIESNNDATAARSKENEAYLAEKVDSEGALEALKSAITTLKGAGTGTKLMSLRATGYQLQDAASRLHRVLQSPQAHKLSETQLELVSRFVKNPQDVASRGIIAVQTGQNPAGDYAPASDQIMGIFKGMVDSYTASLKTTADEEAASKSSFDSLIGTKNTELSTLKGSLLSVKGTLGKDTKTHADKKVRRLDTQDQLAADQEFFEDTKDAAKKKAFEWSTRMRLRTEELNGMKAAIDLLQGGSSLLQTRQVSKHVRARQQESVRHLQHLADKYKSASLVQVMQVMQATGHFDSVMASIDKNIAMLRTEESDDIAHRDRCQEKENAVKNDIADATANLAKVNAKLGRQANAKTTLDASVAAIVAKISTSKGDLKTLADLRKGDKNDFDAAQKAATDQAALLLKSASALSKFYQEQKIAVSLVQKGDDDQDEEAAPESSKDEKKPPKTEFNTAAEHQGESTNIVAILNMLQEDSEKEVQEGKADEARDVAAYEKQRDALQATLDAQKQTKASLEEELATLGEETAASDKVKSQETGDLGAANAVDAAVKGDCDWVASKFADRRTKRKAEIDGLSDAKDFLAGVEAGQAVLA